MIGRAKTSVTGRDSEEEKKGEVLEEGDISGEKVLMSLRGITTITLLKSGVA